MMFLIFSNALNESHERRLPFAFSNISSILSFTTFVKASISHLHVTNTLRDSSLVLRIYSFGPFIFLSLFIKSVRKSLINSNSFLSFTRTEFDTCACTPPAPNLLRKPSIASSALSLFGSMCSTLLVTAAARLFVGLISSSRVASWRGTLVIVVDIVSCIAKYHRLHRPFIAQPRRAASSWLRPTSVPRSPDQSRPCSRSFSHAWRRAPFPASPANVRRRP